MRVSHTLWRLTNASQLIAYSRLVVNLTDSWVLPLCTAYEEHQWLLWIYVTNKILFAHIIMVDRVTIDMQCVYNMHIVKANITAVDKINGAFLSLQRIVKVVYVFFFWTYDCNNCLVLFSILLLSCFMHVVWALGYLLCWIVIFSLAFRYWTSYHSRCYAPVPVFIVAFLFFFSLLHCCWPSVLVFRILT